MLKINRLLAAIFLVAGLLIPMILFAQGAIVTYKAFLKNDYLYVTINNKQTKSIKVTKILVDFTCQNGSVQTGEWSGDGTVNPKTSEDYGPIGIEGGCEYTKYKVKKVLFKTLTK